MAKDLKTGISIENNDLLSLTQPPHAIEAVHRKYLEAGADIIETNTFFLRLPLQWQITMEDLVYELNYESAKIARKVCDEFTAITPKPRFVAGSIGLLIKLHLFLRM